MKKTIAIFSGFYLPFLGGIERYTYNIVQKFVERGYNVVIVTTQHNDKLLNLETFGTVKIYRLPIRNIWKKRYPFFLKNKLYNELLEQIKSESIDYYIVNTRFQLPAILGAKLAKEAGKKAIVIEHGTTYLTLNNPVLDVLLHQVEKKLINIVKKNTDLFYGVSKEASKWLTNFDVQAKGVLYNAIDFEDYNRYFHFQNSEKLIISYSGRLQAKFKGVEMLLSAFSKLSEEFDDIELLIAGDGPIYEEITQKYKQKNINFLGRISHEKVMELNNRSDIFVLMSKIEGFSTSMLEAAQLENVIITTNVGGARELIPNDKYGFVIENNEEALLKTLRQLLTHREEIKEIQKRVSQRVMNKFTWDKTVDEFEKVFIEIEQKEE
ncbi:glycosyltransferase family 4 protein [Lactococcus lactis]|uniref:glycosyltransferase family 4 protein n=1 Tax=Lactococcus lactis TaxID=1358 RepID=UPI00177D68F5|nr:glycosyltransferase family 4 protein [Lactococcus lactis]MBD5854211.1 glycosyltransferase family 1 protein [Lactococcus lactis]